MAMRKDGAGTDRGKREAARRDIGGQEEYLALCTAQVRCRAMRSVIARELRGHMEEQKEAYLADGVEEAEAERLAVEQMGDPLETGTALDRIHRPKMNWKALGAILLLTLCGLIFRIAFAGESGSTYTLYHYIGSSLLGILLMLGICFVDYTILAKYPRTVWCLMTALTLAVTFFTRQMNGMRHSEYMLMLLAPCYAGVVFGYCRQRGRGILKALAWLLVSGIAVCAAGPEAMIGKIWLCGGILMLGYAVAAGWYGVKRWIGTVICGLPVALAAAGTAVAFVLPKSSFRAARLRAFFHPLEDPTGMGYIYVKTKEALAGLKFIGRAGQQYPEDWWLYQGEDFALLHLGEMYGFCMIIFVTIVLLAFAGALFYRISRQSNRLGVLVGIGCIYVFAVSVAIHVLMSIGALPVTSCALPFVSMNGKQNVCMYVLLGLMLSVFRGSSIRPEPQIRFPRLGLRLTWDDRAL